MVQLLAWYSSLQANPTVWTGTRIRRLGYLKCYELAFIVAKGKAELSFVVYGSALRLRVLSSRSVPVKWKLVVSSLSGTTLHFRNCNAAVPAFFLLQTAVILPNLYEFCR